MGLSEAMGETMSSPLSSPPPPHSARLPLSLLHPRTPTPEPLPLFSSCGSYCAEFLQEELPIRLAHRVKELDELPENLSQMPSIIKVKEWYAQSFEVSTYDAQLSQGRGRRTKLGSRAVELIRPSYGLELAY